MPSVDHQPLDLMEHRRVASRRCLAVHPPRADDADRRLLRQHGADLHRRGVGAQQLAPPRPARRRRCRASSRAGWSFGEVERGEIVVVGLDLGPLGDAEAELGEDLLDLVDHLGDRMDAAEGGRAAGEGDVHRRRPPRRLLLGGEELGVELGEALLDRLLEPVDPLAIGAAVRRLDGLDAVEQRADDPLLAADPLHAQRLPARAVADLGGRALELRRVSRQRGDARGRGGLTGVAHGVSLPRPRHSLGCRSARAPTWRSRPAPRSPRRR